MTLADAGARFWLRYVEERGGLWEDTGESTVVVLPDALHEQCGSPDELRVTTDPDVAREDGAALLFAGHPWLMQAAESVLDDADCGLVRLPRPSGPAPDSGQLLTAAREQFPVEHGRIDAAGGASPGVRLLVRLGALVTFAVSSDVRFQEQVECWVDAPSSLELGDEVVARFARLTDLDHPERSLPPPAAGDLLPAVRYAHHRIDERAGEREADLSRQVGDDHGREAERAVAYYDEAVCSLQRRLDAAPPERAATLKAKIASTHAERERRLAEITEKYRAAHQIRPFRLHVLGVPVLRLPVDVRRGERRYPLTLDWLLSARTFAPLRCPACRSAAPLLAAKTGLGCRDCLIKPGPPSRPVAHLVPVPAAAPSTVPATPPPAVPTKPPPPAPPSRSVRSPVTPGPVRSAQAIQKAGHKLVTSLWDLTIASDRRIQRLYAPHSPASAMHALFGAGAALRVIGVDPDYMPLQMYTTDSRPAQPHSDMQLIDGDLRTASTVHGYQLCWRFVGNTALIEELTPFDRAFWPRQPDPRYYPGGPPGRRLYTPAPPRADLDPVAATLWQHSTATHGLPLTMRALAAWWRLDDRDRVLDAYPTGAVAAALDRMIAYRAGCGGRYDEAAATYQVAVADVRRAGADVQRQLRLSSSQPW